MAPVSGSENGYLPEYVISQSCKKLFFKPHAIEGWIPEYTRAPGRWHYDNFLNDNISYVAPLPFVSEIPHVIDSHARL